jgi:hypothetical protein
MNQVPMWFERKFEFTFPLENHPSLCARLRGAPVRLEDVVRGIDPELLVRKPDDKWSAQEHVGHLLDLESLWMARIDDYLADDYRMESTLTAADLSNAKTDEARHNRRPIVEILSEFRAARQGLVSRAERFDPALLARALLHPRLKTPMRLVDHLYFVAEHDDHHLARIWTLLND